MGFVKFGLGRGGGVGWKGGLEKGLRKGWGARLSILQKPLEEPRKSSSEAASSREHHHLWSGLSLELGPLP